MDATQLNPDQQRALDAALSGKHLFITGSAGTGKSRLIQAIKERLEFMRVAVAFCGPTGITAHNIGGQTLHKFSSLGLAQEPYEILLEKILRNKWICRQWRSLKVLVLDEISMIDLRLFTYLSRIFQHVREDHARPFGGVQIIMVGDFYQIMPVKQYSGNEFLFECPVWKELDPYCIELRHVYRQSDSAFVSLLARVRTGDTTQEDMSYLASLNRPIPGHPMKNVTQLMSLNKTVDEVNAYNLDKLEGEEHTYTGRAGMYEDVDGDNLTTDVIMRMKDTMRDTNPVGDTVYLKAGAEIILRQNMSLLSVGMVEYKFYNGSRGYVTHFDKMGNPVVRFYDAPDTEDTFFTINPYTWEQRKYGYKQVITYTQIPIKLAWAITCHSAQGLTISPLAISLGADLFCHGQAYVALSRCKSPDLLCIRNFKPTKPFIVSDKVKLFYKNLALNTITESAQGLSITDGK